ncbi:MAG TPA: hypothetical protein HA302_01300 [Thermococcaceae archaeon]|uniref:Uncharacterized protein n=2 Tax=Thermococcus sibiricus TaxID=172049 RepID=C6A2W9_THESM|nr:hypothetical protein [Thermococcus sibiricus]ACS89964.1 hypothetical protein TSIB_0906 [Thermococcus sibiricus MM 739]KUK18561.1 MAG: Uncharacterized protein XD54_0121 [Thermococcus sibiricus]KUK29428.1 MAG: Uncharacterized protein XD61_0074 [Thermococcus sp. 40_45]HII66656.1 hypothetical protein [Thermococcaceae archaeon]
MIIYEPVMLAIPLAEKIKDYILKTKEMPRVDELKEILRELNLKNLYLDRGFALYRSKHVFALLISFKEYITIDIISSSGDLSDAMEIMIYHDKTLDSYIVEIVPVNELEFEGNIGIEPVIIDAKTFELKSNPVLGHFEKGNGEVFLVIDESTYKKWEESNKTDHCPICGAKELTWHEKVAYCDSCGFGVKVVKE